MMSAEAQFESEYFRGYVKANMFDGSEGGIVTARVDVLLDDLMELFQTYYEDRISQSKGP